jgi:hypothetical protein
MQYIISELLNIPRGNSNMFQDTIKIYNKNTKHLLINKLQNNSMIEEKQFIEEEYIKKANIISELTNLPIDIVRVHIISKLYKF